MKKILQAMCSVVVFIVCVTSRAACLSQLTNMPFLFYSLSKQKIK